MKKLLYSFVLLFTVIYIPAQTENYTIAIDQFQKNYNTEKYNDVFNSFSSEMKQALPFEKTREFLGGLKAQVGKMENKEFISYQHRTYASYKIQFEKNIFVVNISLDNQNKINGLFIKPYEEEKEIQPKAVNALNVYPKEIADLIFSKSKNLPNKAQLSIAIVQNGKTGYYGIIKDHDSIKPAANQNKIFEIGSITKIFTATVLASLVESNHLKLSDNINSYYPFPFKNNTNISFESLANHTSGLPRLPQNLEVSNMSNPYKNYHSKELGKYLKNLLKFENEPLKKYSYSNLGAGLLGYTLGVSQKTTFQKLLQKKIFEKYKMHDSFTNSENLGNKLVKGYNKDGEPVLNWDFDVLFGCGGMLSTTEDLVKFANTQLDAKNKELALTRKPSFTVNDTMKIGLGWHIIKMKNDQEVIWHNGGTGGYSSSMAVNVGNKTAVIILSNVSEVNEQVDSLCFELLNNTNKK